MVPDSFVTPDVIESLLRRDAAAAESAPLSYVHAIGGLGAALAVRAWLVDTGRADRTQWLDLSSPLVGTTATPTSEYAGVTVIEGADGGRELDLGDYPVGSECIVMGTSAPHGWRIEKGARVWSSADFLLSAEEIDGIARGRGLSLTAQARSECLTETAGWPVLVDLVLGSYEAGEAIDSLGRGLTEALPQLGDATLSGLSEIQRSTAEVIAFADGLASAEIDVLGPEVVAAARDLRSLRLCTTRDEDGHTVLRMVGLLGRWFRQSLRSTDAAGSHELLVGLARRRDELALLDRGLRFAYQARDWMLCSRIADRWGPELAASRDWELLMTATMEMPPEATRAYPGTWHRAEFLGLVPVGSAPVATPTDADHARRLCASEEGVLMLKRTAMAIIARRFHHQHGAAEKIVERAAPLATAALRNLPGEAGSIGTFWYLHAGIALELAGSFDQARHHYLRGWELRRMAHAPYIWTDVVGKLAAQAAWRGENREAERWLAEPLPDRSDEGKWFEPFLPGAVNQATLLLACDTLDRASSMACVELVQGAISNDEHWPFVLMCRVQHLLTWGEPGVAMDLVDEAARIHHAALACDGVHRSVWESQRADVALALGRGALAARALTECGSLPLAAALPARLRLLAGEPAAALDLATTALDGPLWRRPRTQLLLIQAVARLDLGDLPGAAEAATQAVSQVSDHHDLRTLATVQRAALHRLGDLVPLLVPLLAELDATGVGHIYDGRLEHVELSDREQAVLHSLARGRTLRQTAAELFVSVNTIKTQTRSLYLRLGVNDRAALINEAQRHGLIERRTDHQERG